MPETNRWSRRWISVAGVLATIALGGFLMWSMPSAPRLGLIAPLLVIAAQAVTVVILPIPAWPVMAFSVALFGPWVGFGLSFIGVVVGSVAAFLIGRWLRPVVVDRWSGRFASAFARTDGWWLVPLLALPVPVGGDVGCFVAGATRLRLRRFVAMASLGRIPGTTLGVLAAAGVTTGSATVLIVAAVLLLVLLFLARGWRDKRGTDAPPEVARTVPARAEPRQPAPTVDVLLPRPVAFAFGAGGSHGAIQVGQLRALREYGVRPDILVGSSVGALNAAMLAGHPDDDRVLDRLDALWRRIRARDLAGRSGQGALQRRAVFGNDGLRHLAERHLPAGRAIEELPIPLYVLATECSSRQPRVLDRDALIPALLASCAIPFVFPPVRVDGRRLVDGGIRHDLPIGEALTVGAASVVAFPTTRWPDPIGYRSSAPISDPRVLTLSGAASPGTGWTFHRTEALIERGYRETSTQLRALLSGVGPESHRILLRHDSGELTPMGGVSSESMSPTDRIP